MAKTNQILETVTWAELKRKLGLTSQLPVPNKQKTVSGLKSISSALLAQLLQHSCQDGERTAHLVQLVGTLLAQRYGLEECQQLCHQWNKNNQPPLDDDKVDATCVSVHAIDQRNHPERYQHDLKDVPLFDLSAGRVGRYLGKPPLPRRWLLQDLVVLGKVGAVIAPGGSSKSQWMLQLGVSVATGIDLADHWKVGEMGSVMMFFAEDDHDEIHRRLHRIHSRLTMAGHSKALESLNDHLYIFSTIGTNTLLTKTDNAGEVSATVTVDRIAAMARGLPDLRLIVIDSCSRFRGGEENSNEDATRFVEALEKLAQMTGASVMLAHHANKNSTSNGDVSQGASRGASALTDGLRLQMNMNRPTDAQATAFGLPKDRLGNFVAATVTKSNYSPIPPPVLLEREHDGYLSAVNATQARNTIEQMAIVAVLRVLDALLKPIAARRLEEDHGGVKNTLKMSKQAVRETVERAIHRGLIEGGERKPLMLTAAGAGLLKCFPAAAADAVQPSKNAPRKKT